MVEALRSGQSQAVVVALSSAERAARSPWVGRLGRIGFTAQGTCFVIIAVLALELAFGKSGALTDPRGAFVVLAAGGWTRVLLVLLAIGFGGYSIWRFAQAIFDRGGMGSSPGGLGRRAIQLGQAVLYALLTASAVHVLVGSRAQGSPKRAAAGILGWPGGPEIVGAIGAAVAIVAVVNVYWGLSGRFTESLRLGEVDVRTEELLKLVGTIGFVALGLVLGVISWFLLKAAIDFDAGKVVSLGGAMARVARADYGKWLLTAVAAGLLAYGVFGLLQARYHRV
ncbi:MAG: DUF1206 domain-containing protein [Actinobacteria bacterium]|nr:MAG: DUF1206 domain-containing protein [Actinomycetota bacterium]